MNALASVTFHCPDCGDKTQILGRCIPCHKRHSLQQAEILLASANLQLACRRTGKEPLITLADVVSTLEQALSCLKEAK